MVVVRYQFKGIKTCSERIPQEAQMEFAVLKTVEHQTAMVLHFQPAFAAAIFRRSPKANGATLTRRTLAEPASRLIPCDRS